MKYFLALLCLAGSSCGYHVSGRSDLMPTTLKTIAVPAFRNLTNRYKITDFIPQAISEELITRTRYKVVDQGRADAVLDGTVIGFSYNPTVFDPATGRASVADVHLILQVSLVERASGKVLYTRPRLEVIQSYQISPDAAQYFDESDAALRRASKQLAGQIISNILENF